MQDSKKQTRIVAGVGAVLLIVGVLVWGRLLLPSGETKERLEPVASETVEVHLDALRATIESDRRFDRIELEITEGRIGAGLLVSGLVDSLADYQALIQVISESDPPCPVETMVDVES